MAAALKLTGSPTSGLAGVKEKAASGGAFTVTERVVVAGAPSASVTRRLTVRVPALENECPTSRPSASVLPLPSKSQSKPLSGIASSSVVAPASNVAVCPMLGRAGEKRKDGFGGVFRALTVTLRVVLVERPPESVTCSRTVLMPELANAWSASSPVASMDPLLSKSQPNAPLGSDPPSSDPDASKLTVSPISGPVGEKTKDAVGGALTVTVWETVSATPRMSVTRSDTVRDPDGYDAVGVMPSASSNWPSPSKSHA